MKSFFLAFIFLVFFTALVFSEDSEVWTKTPDTDAFGDLTGGFICQKLVYGYGSSLSTNQKNEVQGITIVYQPSSNQVFFLIKNCDYSDIPLNIHLLEIEEITLRLKDLNNKTYAFRGGQYTEFIEKAMMIGIDRKVVYELVTLLRKKGTYKAVIEGYDWSCNFTFDGGMPQ